MIEVDISGLDKVELLKALWRRQKIMGWCASHGLPSFDVDRVTEKLETYIDYWNGKCIKMNLSGDKVDAWCYDRDAGEGATQEVVDTLRRATAQNEG